MLYLAPAALLVALVLGFLGGSVIYRQSRRWCTTCGSTLRCQCCQRLAPSVGSDRAPSAAGRWR